MRELVPNEPLREAFLRSDLSAADVARAAGWFTTRGYPDGPKVTRLLGLRPDQGGKVKAGVSWRTAGVLCRALGLYPVDVGC